MVSLQSCGLWAGESRPLFAVLNGPYNNGTSKTGDIPWTYQIEWQFAEPVWEEEGTGEDITYTTRPPDESQGEEIVPSTILTGAHRLKTDESPLYLADMTSITGGPAYVRAVIKNVDIDGGEVVQGTGTTSVMSMWVLVQARSEMELVTSNGDPTRALVPYCDPMSPDGGEPIELLADEIETFSLTLTGPFDPGSVDTITAELNGETRDLVETAVDSLVFCYEDTPIVFTVTVEETSGLTDGVLDYARVLVDHTTQEVDDRVVIAVERDGSSTHFELQKGSLFITLPGELSPTHVDTLAALLTDPYTGTKRQVTLTEVTEDSRVFVDDLCGSDLQVWIVDSPTSLDPEVIDTMLCGVSTAGSSACDDWYVRVQETREDSAVFFSALQTGTEDADGPDPDRASDLLRTLRVRRFPSVFGTQIPYYAFTACDSCVVPTNSIGLELVSVPLLLMAPGSISSAEELELPPGTKLVPPASGPAVPTREIAFTAHRDFEHILKKFEVDAEGKPTVYDVVLYQERAITERFDIGFYDTIGCTLYEIGFHSSGQRGQALNFYYDYDLHYVSMMGYIPHLNKGATAASFLKDLKEAGKVVGKTADDTPIVQLPIGILVVTCHGDGRGYLSFPWLQATESPEWGWSLEAASRTVTPTWTSLHLFPDEKVNFKKFMRHQHPRLVYFIVCGAGAKASEWRKAANADMFVGWNDSFHEGHIMGYGNNVLRLSWWNMYISQDKWQSLREIVDETNDDLEALYEKGVHDPETDPYHLLKIDPGDSDAPRPFLILDADEGEDTRLETIADPEDADPEYDYPKYLETNPSWKDYHPFAPN